jgi:hypothetical protein
MRLRFDWGDGVLSDWSSVVSSNVSVSFSHTWSNVSTNSVRAIAQGETGSNSSWSDPLTVTVSQAMSGNQSPVASFVLPSKVTLNQTVMFDASGSIDTDGVIISYMWDFGDGTHGTGKTPTHSYQSPGHYTVTLTVTDDTGLTSSVTMAITVFTQASTPPPVAKASSPSYVPMFALIGVIGTLLVFIVVFRDPLWAFLFARSSIPSRSTLNSSDSEIATIEELLNKLFLDMQRHALPTSKENLLEAYCDLIVENVEANADVRLPNLSITEVERIVDESFHARVTQKIDKM